TRLTMRRLGDGTTRISSRVPDAAATRLATYLEAYANPRRIPADNDPADNDPGDRDQAEGDQADQDQVGGVGAGTATAHDPVARLA
ncbi:hypothetical protein SGI37_20490, partial [Providencia rettgeri]